MLLLRMTLFKWRVHEQLHAARMCAVLTQHIHAWAASLRPLYKPLAVASRRRLLSHNSLPTGYLCPCELDTLFSSTHTMVCWALYWWSILSQKQTKSVQACADCLGSTNGNQNAQLKCYSRFQAYSDGRFRQMFSCSHFFSNFSSMVGILLIFYFSLRSHLWVLRSDNVWPFCAFTSGNKNTKCFSQFIVLRTVGNEKKSPCKLSRHSAKN